MRYWDGGSGGSWIVMISMMAVLWGAVIAGIVLLVRSGNAYKPAPPHYEAERILAERFARGEIESEEFEKRRTALGNRT
jgi:putative membrane protein